MHAMETHCSSSETTVFVTFEENYAGLKKEKNAFTDPMQLHTTGNKGSVEDPLVGVAQLGANAELYEPAAFVYTGGHVAPLAANTH